MKAGKSLEEKDAHMTETARSAFITECHNQNTGTKLVQLLSLLPRRPCEFIDRVATKIETRVELHLHKSTHYPSEEWSMALAAAGKVLKKNLTNIMCEQELERIEESVRHQLLVLPPDAPFLLAHNADLRLARLSYALVRALAPTAVVETGVCYGVTSAFILAALERNGTGVLCSIDLPPLAPGGDRFVGWLIPPMLRSRWRLFRGTSAALLPRIVADVGTVGMFIHDSLHTYRNIRRELQTVTPALAPRSVVLADDIHGNSSFLEWAAQHRPAYWAAVGEESKQNLLGLGVFAPQT